MTKQEQMKATLAKAGIAFKDIEVYGSQIVVTAWSETAAKRWAGLLSRFATVRGVVRTIDRNEDQSNASSNLLPAVHTVWRIGASI